MTFAATANAVVHSGATPVLADVERGSMCLDPDDFERKITPRTRAVIPVHFAGRPFAVDRVLEVADAHGVIVVEDCAHAIETLWLGRHAGTFGRFGAFSFYVTKNVVTAEGGMLVTDDEVDAARARRLGLHGLSADAWMRFRDDGYKHYEVEEPGFKFNMTDLQAALGIGQLGRVERNLERREAIWSRYDEAFADLPLDLPPPVQGNTRHARHLYTIMVDRERAGVSREDVQRRLHDLGIGTGVHYRALHLHRWYQRTLRVAPEDLPNAAWISDRTLSLPLGPGTHGRGRRRRGRRSPLRRRELTRRPPRQITRSFPPSTGTCAPVVRAKTVAAHARRSFSRRPRSYTSIPSTLLRRYSSTVRP